MSRNTLALAVGSWRVGEPVGTVCVEFEAYPKPMVLTGTELARTVTGIG